MNAALEAPLGSTTARPFGECPSLLPARYRVVS